MFVSWNYAVYFTTWNVNVNKLVFKNGWKESILWKKTLVCQLVDLLTFNNIMRRRQFETIKDRFDPEDVEELVEPMLGSILLLLYSSYVSIVSSG